MFKRNQTLRYGAALSLLASAFLAPGVQAAGTLTPLHNFGSPATDGQNPSAGLILGSDGNFYGTTEFGGANGDGAIYKISPSGTLTTLYSFSGSTDGSYIQAGLVKGSDGNFYGVAEQGGTYTFGTAFKITPAGVLSVLHEFGAAGDGRGPSGSLIQASDGNFYGTTGGSPSDGGGGTVFKMTPAGVETVLYTFAVGAPNTGVNSTGDGPGNLVQGSDGNLYGATSGGGSSGYGTVFKITTSGSITTLHDFDNADGYNPSGLVQDGSGIFYGTAGTVAFKITSAGAYTIIARFNTGLVGPSGNLLLGSDGNFYGTCDGGGTNFTGGIFELTPGGTLTTLYSFNSGGDGEDNVGGATPVGGLIQGSNGNFYGTALYGGQYGDGTVFEFVN